MSSLSSWTKGNVTSLLAKTLIAMKQKTKNVSVRRETFRRLWDPLASNTNWPMETHFGMDTVCGYIFKKPAATLEVFFKAESAKVDLKFMAL